MSIPADCVDCIKGVRHEGEPKGKLTQIGGVECYVATPEGEHPQDKAILFLTDVFGIPLINNKLLADDFARNGFLTVMPDLFNGDPIINMNDPSFNMNAWRPKHGPESWLPVVDNVVAALKESGVSRIGTTGYCFGAPPAFHLAFKNESVVTVVSHPSLLVFPDDLEKYRGVSKAPILFNSCPVDAQFPPDKQTLADEILGGGKFAPGYERTYWEGCRHGFAVRGDLSDPLVKAGKEGSFAASVKFFKKYL